MPLNELMIQIPPLPHFLTAGQDVFPPGSQHVERQQIGVFDLIVVTGGALHIGEAGTNKRVGPGQALILRPDLHHYPTKPCEAETHFYWVHFRIGSPWTESIGASGSSGSDSASGSSPVSGLHGSAGGRFASRVDTDKNEEEGLADHVQSSDFGHQYELRLPRYAALANPQETYADMDGLLALSARADLAGSWRQQTIFHRLLFRLCKEAQGEHTESAVTKLAERTASWLKANYRQSVTNERLREELNYHPIYITRCMRAVYDRTPNEFLNEYRLEQAKLLLLTTDKPVTDIAAAVGFEDPAYFARRFAASVSLSPSAYRKQFEVRG
ncbi:helix-turn-helix transcriptional regulator [Paenibacillus sacheonensis]|uniref:Helix-turn-helix domain-containing protein n=1 Tax=Paenibacillus sacheonensis TaxID=742054 RepID=A0A7X5C4M2_9BACL|nr:helix-turn-helix transcriptional regulator [Paenibacillus sacheonensis]MBM7568824.1 AraC-like DNA-binding protein [Paenibacillus sacheonensis]NBC72529.1 helix-turn-helix domain-containing protein [Paenibacillus sacheonensis]